MRNYENGISVQQNDMRTRYWALAWTQVSYSSQLLSLVSGSAPSNIEYYNDGLDGAAYLLDQSATILHNL